MSYEASGKIHEIFPEQQVSEKFRKKEFVLEVQDGMYANFIKFELSQDKCSLLDGYKTGQGLKVHFNLSGKPFENKEGKTMYFNNLRAWKVEADSSNSSSIDDEYTAPTNNSTNEDFNDVPF